MPALQNRSSTCPRRVSLCCLAAEEETIKASSMFNQPSHPSGHIQEPLGIVGPHMMTVHQGNGDGHATESSSLLHQTEIGASENGSEICGTTSHSPQFANGLSTRRFWLIFSQILAVQFISSFDGTIMMASHPVITTYFGAAKSASWLSTAFLLTSTAFPPLFAQLSDAAGRKPVFLGAVILFAVTTIWCASSQRIESLIVARAICGIGAGGSKILGFIIIGDLVPIGCRGSSQSCINIVLGAGSALGAMLGGIMAEALGWRWMFGVQVLPLLVCFGVAVISIPDNLGVMAERKTIVKTFREFDAAGFILLILVLSFLILGLNLGGSIIPWSHPLVVASLSALMVCFPIFLIVESRAPKPIMPLKFIFSMPHANLIFSNFSAALISHAILFNMPIYFQAVLLRSATSSGLHLVLPAIIASVMGAATGFAITRTRRLKWPLVCGAVLYAFGAVSLALLRRNLPAALYLLALVPHSLGSGLQFPGTLMAILTVSTQHEQAVVTSTLMLWRNLGQVLGVAASSFVVQNALLYYLESYISDEHRDEIIARVRASVEAVAHLSQPHREQVMHSYESALRLTFGCCIVVAVMSVLLIVPVKLPRLPSMEI